MASISSPVEVFLMPVRRSPCCNHPDQSEVVSKESVQLPQVSQNLPTCSHTVSTWKPHLGTVGGIVTAALDDQQSQEHIHNPDLTVSTDSQKVLHLSND
jgi:hypothetical protein